MSTPTKGDLDVYNQRCSEIQISRFSRLSSTLLVKPLFGRRNQKACKEEFNTSLDYIENVWQLGLLSKTVSEKQNKRRC